MVAETTVDLVTLGAFEVIERIESLRSDAGGIVAFDGDGTLWSGDVGEDLFEAALEQQLFRGEALSSLRETASRHELAVTGSASEVAARIYRAYREGRFPERVACEVMTWGYAGWSLEELSEFVRETLRARHLSRRLNRKLEPILQYARESELRAVVISASPHFAVEQAAAHWSFAVSDIAAAVPKLEQRIVLPELAAPIPYGPAKKVCGQALFGDAAWLASFGDSAFDLEMLLAARLGVAVTPKHALRQALQSVPSVVLLA